MVGMIAIIKSTSLEMVRKIRRENKDGDIVDFVKISAELMSIVIVNVCVGNGRAYDKIEFIGTNGKQKICLYEAMI